MKTQISPGEPPPLWVLYLEQYKKHQDATYRVFIYGFGLTIGYLGITDEKSLMFAAGQERGGSILIGMIIAASIIGFLDMFINRQKSKIGWPWLKKHRHFILLSLAFCFFGQLLVAYNSIRSDGVILFYIWPGIVTAFAAVSDARKRRRERCAAL